MTSGSVDAFAVNIPLTRGHTEGRSVDPGCASTMCDTSLVAILSSEFMLGCPTSCTQVAQRGSCPQAKGAELRTRIQQWILAGRDTSHSQPPAELSPFSGKISSVEVRLPGTLLSVAHMLECLALICVCFRLPFTRDVTFVFTAKTNSAPLFPRRSVM